MTSDPNFGSLALQPKRPRVWGDDQTTTRMEKAERMRCRRAEPPEPTTAVAVGGLVSLCVVTLIVGGFVVSVLVLAARQVLRWLA